MSEINAPIFDETDEYMGITLGRYMVEVVAANSHIPKIRELEELVMSIQTACKTISSVVERASITGILGLESGGGSINIQGEEQKRLDIITNNIMKKALRFSGTVDVLASEEEEKPVSYPKSLAEKYRTEGLVTTQFKSDVVIQRTDSCYVAVFDPLDGSSNVDAGIPTGTIFGVFQHDAVKSEERATMDHSAYSLAETLKAGSSMVAAGYCLYSSSTFFCLTIGCGVNIFTYDRQIGEFVLTNAQVQIPKRGKIYSFNEAHRKNWDLPLQKFVDDIQNGQGESGQQYSGRYIGSMVGDIHRTLLYGGIFGYPATKKNPRGKLRLLYEAAPMSFLIEQAGGLATTGTDRVMDIIPTTVHQRVPCVMGSKEDVLEVGKYYKLHTTN
eukprot:gene7612-10364_t